MVTDRPELAVMVTDNPERRPQGILRYYGRADGGALAGADGSGAAAGPSG